MQGKLIYKKNNKKKNKIIYFLLWFVDFVRICSLTIVCLFFLDLRINYYLLLIYDPNKHIGLVQRRHKHNWTDMQFILAFILLKNGSFGTFTN